MPMNKLRHALPEIIGRTIEHVVFNDNGDGFMQVFLHFTDGTYYEFYGRYINGTRHVDTGRLELHGLYGYIPTKGRLEVLDAKTVRVLERPPAAPVPAPVTPAPAPPESVAARWGHSLAFWLR